MHNRRFFNVEAVCTQIYHSVVKGLKWTIVCDVMIGLRWHTACVYLLHTHTQTFLCHFESDILYIKRCVCRELVRCVITASFIVQQSQ
jgi:hypothetical protein